jgi:hypothetical protein
MLPEGDRLVLPDLDALAVEEVHERVEVRGGEAAEEVAGRGRVGDALRAQDVEVGLVVPKQFEILQVLAAGQEVVGEAEDVVGLEVGQMALEQAQLPVDGLGQAEALDKELASAEAAGVQAAALVANLVVDVAVPEHPLALFLPLPLAQATADAALAIAEPPVYLGVHLSYLHERGKGYRFHKSISPQMSGFFKLRTTFRPPKGALSRPRKVLPRARSPWSHSRRPDHDHEDHQRRAGELPALQVEGLPESCRPTRAQVRLRGIAR